MKTNNETSGAVAPSSIPLPNVKVVAPPPLGSEGVEIEKLKGGCPPTACSDSFVTLGGIRIRVGMLGTSVGIILDSEDDTRLIFPHVISMGVADFHTFIDRLESLMPRKKPSVQAQHPFPQTPTSDHQKK